MSEKVGLNRISWRYDPIFITEKYSLEFHLKTFAEMAAALAGYTDHCVISFLDLYDKTKRNFPEGRSVNRQERFAIGEAFAAIGKEHGMTIKTCAEGTELEVFGVDTGGCQTKEVLERAIGLPLTVPGNAMTRSECSACWEATSGRITPAVTAASIAMPTTTRIRWNLTWANTTLFFAVFDR